MNELTIGVMATLITCFSLVMGLILKRLSDMDAKLDRHMEQSPSTKELEERWKGHWQQHKMEREKVI